MNTTTQPTESAAATGQIDTTSPACVAASAGGSEDAGQHGGADRAPVTGSQPAPQGWQTGEPPRDRPIVARGQVCWRDRSGGGVDPFVAAIRWHKTPEGGFWIFDDSELAVSFDADAKVVIFHWIDLPAGRGA